MAMSPESALRELDSAKPLNIIELADSLRPKEAQSAQKRTSGVSEDSADAFDNATPAGLEADLIHYKELFGKLRFSYVEQVTKEKFLRGITDNPPLFVEAEENARLERELVDAKKSLKEQKVEVANLIKELEKFGKGLAQRYENVTLRIQNLASLPPQISNLESTISSLRASLAASTPSNPNPTLNLPLPETQELLTQRNAELDDLNAQVAALQAQLPRKKAEAEKLEAELKPLETQKKGVVREAIEARRAREEGGGLGDELEERGRWYRASEKALREMLGVEG